MAILLIGLNHTVAPVALRERFFFSGAALCHALTRLCALPDIDEAVILSTCNRTEILASGQDPAVLIEALADQSQLTVDDLRQHLYCYTDHMAVTHLFRVACGLDSLVIGETQILKQLRDALGSAVEMETAGRQLTGLIQQALAAGKRARTETLISQGAFSIGRAGVELARTLFPNLTNSPVLVLGAGKMSELTARHLAANGVQTIFVANRTHQHAVDLARRLNGRAIRYAGLECAMMEVDILISSTSAPHLILHAEDVARIMARRSRRPLCLIDIAVPRDIDPAAGDLPGVHLYNVDDLRDVADRDGCRRQAEVPKVERIIDEEVANWHIRHAGLTASPVIAALHNAFEQVRRRELDQVTHLLAGLTPEQHSAVEALTVSIVNKLLHTPTVRLKELLANHPERQPQLLLCELFALDNTQTEGASCPETSDSAHVAAHSR